MVAFSHTPLFGHTAGAALRSSWCYDVLWSLGSANAHLSLCAEVTFFFFFLQLEGEEISQSVGF